MSADFVVGLLVWLFIGVPVALAILGWIVAALTAPFRARATRPARPYADEED